MWIIPKKSNYMHIVVTSTIKIEEVHSYILDCGNHAWVSTTLPFFKNFEVSNQVAYSESNPLSLTNNTNYREYHSISVVYPPGHFALHLGKFQYNCLLFTHQYCKGHPFTI